MQNRMKVLVAAALVVALLAGACAGIAYQKEQPVYDVHIITYTDEGATVISDENYNTTNMIVNLWPIYSSQNISGYRITVNQK